MFRNGQNLYLVITNNYDNCFKNYILIFVKLRLHEPLKGGKCLQKTKLLP